MESVQKMYPTSLFIEHKIKVSPVPFPIHVTDSKQLKNTFIKKAFILLIAEKLTPDGLITHTKQKSITGNSENYSSF